MHSELEFLTKTICHIAEQALGISSHDALLKRTNVFYGRKRRGMIFRGYLALSLPMDHQTDAKILELYRLIPKIRRYFDIIITAEHNVFATWYINDNLRMHYSMPDAKLFKNLSNHDIGWKDGVEKTIRHNFWEMAEQLNKQLENKGHSHLRPIDMEIDLELGSWLGNNPLQFVEVEMRHPNGESYLYNLTAIKFRKVTMDFVEETET